MRKLFGILALSAIFGTAMAQEGGNFQVVAILGNQTMAHSIPLPNFGSANTGLGNTGTNTQSNSPETYLKLDEAGTNSITNMVGVQLAYYLGPVDANIMYSQDLSIRPKKDFIDNSELYDATDQYDLYRQPNEGYINGQVKSNWYLNVGGNFHVENKRANGYAGVRLGYKKSRLETLTAYNGSNGGFEVDANGNSTQSALNTLYQPQTKEGKVASFQTAIVAGAECVANCGFVFGVEFLPFAYQYSVVEIDPDGMYHYACSHKSVRFFSTPTLKLGVRF